MGEGDTSLSMGEGIKRFHHPFFFFGGGGGITKSPEWGDQKIHLLWPCGVVQILLLSFKELASKKKSRSHGPCMSARDMVAEKNQPAASLDNLNLRA